MATADILVAETGSHYNCCGLLMGDAGPPLTPQDRSRFQEHQSSPGVVGW